MFSLLVFYESKNSATTFSENADGYPDKILREMPGIASD